MSKEIIAKSSITPAEIYTKPIIDDLMGVAEKVKQAAQMIDKLLITLDAIDEKLWDTYQDFTNPEVDEEDDTKQSEVERLLKENKKLLEKLNNKYLLLVYYQNKPNLEGFHQFSVSIVQENVYLIHQNNTYNQDYQIFEKNVSKELYWKIQRELAECKYIIGWDIKKKSFKCDSKHVPEVLGIFRNNIAAFRESLEQ